MFMKWNYSCILYVGAAMAAATALTGCPEEPAAYEAQAPGGEFAAPPPGGSASGAPQGATAPGQEAGQAADAQAGAPGNPPPPSMMEVGTGTAMAAEGGHPAAPPAGEAGEGGAVGAAMSIEDFPKEIATQASLKNKGVRISGKLKGAECEGKKVRLDALQQTGGNPPIRLVTAKIKTGVGSYDLLVPKTDKATWILASCDVNGDGQILPGTDYSAAYEKNPITPTKAISGVTLSLTLGKLQAGLPNLRPGSDPTEAMEPRKEGLEAPTD